MGYLKGLPSEMVQTFGSGTGLSGFTGVLTVLFLQALGVSQGKVFLILGVLVIPYFLAFSWIDDKRKMFVKDETMYPELNNVENVNEIQVKPQNIVDASDGMEFDKKVQESPAAAIFEIVSLPPL